MFKQRIISLTALFAMALVSFGCEQGGSIDQTIPESPDIVSEIPIEDPTSDSGSQFDESTLEKIKKMEEELKVLEEEKKALAEELEKEKQSERPIAEEHTLEEETEEPADIEEVKPFSVERDYPKVSESWVSDRVILKFSEHVDVRALEGQIQVKALDCSHQVSIDSLDRYLGLGSFVWFNVSPRRHDCQYEIRVLAGTENMDRSQQMKDDFVFTVKAIDNSAPKVVKVDHTPDYRLFAVEFSEPMDLDFIQREKSIQLHAVPWPFPIAATIGVWNNGEKYPKRIFFAVKDPLKPGTTYTLNVLGLKFSNGGNTGSGIQERAARDVAGNQLETKYNLTFTIPSELKLLN